MLLSSLLLIPILGIFLIYSRTSYHVPPFWATSLLDGFVVSSYRLSNVTPANGETNSGRFDFDDVVIGEYNNSYFKLIALGTSVINLIISLIIYISFDFSSNQFQFVQEDYDMSYFDIYMGIDGLSIYFVLLTTIIMPIALLSNWNSITGNIKSYLIIILLLETLLLAVFLVLDILLFYIFFESILVPLFILIGLFGSKNKVRASYYLFLYTLFSSLFMLLAILTISSIAGTTDFEVVFKLNLDNSLQLILFSGLFFAIAVKTPLYGLNSWLLKAHTESPLGGSIILAAIVLKLALYGIFRLLLPIVPQACLDFTPLVFILCVITVLFASFSTLRTTDIKEIIAYSSVSHAAVYLLGVFSNTIQGIEGAILLGLGHGFVSSGLFIIVGGVLYDRSGTRDIAFYRGMTQLMPMLSILFLLLILANCGTPLTLNFVGEFLSLYGGFERLPIIGVFSSFSIVLSAAYSVYLYNRIAFGGSFSRFFVESFIDLTRREFFILFILVLFTVIFGVYPSFILDGIHYSVSGLIYSTSEYSYLTAIAPVFSIIMPSGLNHKYESLCSEEIEKNDEIIENYFSDIFTNGLGKNGFFSNDYLGDILNAKILPLILPVAFFMGLSIIVIIWIFQSRMIQRDIKHMDPVFVDSRRTQRDINHNNSVIFGLSIRGVQLDQDPLTWVLTNQLINNTMRNTRKNYKRDFRLPNTTLSKYGQELVLARSITAGPYALGLAKAWIDSGELAHERGVMGKKAPWAEKPKDPIVVNEEFIVLMFSLRFAHPAIQRVNEL